MTMASLTRSGVCYDLRHSPFDSGYGTLLLKFSSASHKSKFDEEVHKRELWLNDSLGRRFHCRVFAADLAALHLYRQVETRGFCVYDACADEWLDSMESITFDLVMR